MVLIMTREEYNKIRRLYSCNPKINPEHWEENLKRKKYYQNLFSSRNV